ncbi:hypothetical protein QCA50_015232 [Cerrena zonata]|uniref:Uncharacterized protein n=1 Tax=Cerrena zonata TaxID=2478898 RepID=A0AAW0FRE4_9APHY
MDDDDSLDLTELGLLPEHKSRMQEFAPEYRLAKDGNARRAIAKRAADDVISHFKMSDKNEIALTRLRVSTWFYDRFVRPFNHVKPAKFGFLKKITGSQLWAASNWEDLKEMVEAHLADPQNADAVWIGAYQTVKKAAWDGVDGLIQKEWEEEADKINKGNITTEQKALYGDMQFVSFIDTVLHCAEQYFGAHMVILSSRPTKVDGRKFSHSVKETTPKDYRTTFIDSIPDPYAWPTNQFYDWVRLELNGERKPLDKVVFDKSGIPLLSKFPPRMTGKERRKAVVWYLTAHYCMACSNPNAHPPYLEIMQDVSRYIDAEFLPPEALVEGTQWKLNKPGIMKAEDFDAFVNHIRARQIRYLTGESNLVIFKWKAYQKKRGDSAVEIAKYDSSWMIRYAREHGTVIEHSDFNREDDDPSREASTVADRQRVTLRNVIGDHAPVAGGSGSGIDVDDGTQLSSEERDHVDLQDHHERGDGADSDHEISIMLGQDKGKQRAQDTAETQPTIVPNEDPVTDDLESLLAQLTSKQRKTTSVEDPRREPPTWAQNDPGRKMQFLSSLTTDQDYLSLLGWFKMQKPSMTTDIPHTFTWGTWDHPDVFLPESIHIDEMEFIRFLQYILQWKKDTHKSLQNLTNVEEFLLVTGLVLRDGVALHFPFDEGDPGDELPSYITDTSQISQDVVAKINAVLKAVAQASIVGTRDTSSQRPYPLPRQRARAGVAEVQDDTGSAVRPTTPVGDGKRATADAPRSPITPSRGGPAQKKSKNATTDDTAVDIRRSGRPRVKPRRFDDSDDDGRAQASGSGRDSIKPTSKGSSRGRGGGRKGSQTRGRGKKA